MAKTDPRPKTAKGLTIKQDRFVREYVKHGNGTQAALAAGYTSHVPAAAVQASQNLQKPKIAEEVAKYRRRNMERLDISREKLLNDAAHDAEQASLNADYSAANGSRTFIAKVQGYVVDRHVNLNVDLSQAHLDALQDLMNKRNHEPTLSNNTNHRPVHHMDMVDGGIVAGGKRSGVVVDGYEVKIHEYAPDDIITSDDADAAVGVGHEAGQGVGKHGDGVVAARVPADQPAQHDGSVSDVEVHDE